MSFENHTVIFLDIDGVLNQLQKDYIDKKCVGQLAKLYKKMNAVIVLTSSWRKGYLNTGKCTPQIESLKEALAEYDMEISGRTMSAGGRTEQIEQYVISHGITNYIILDDDIREYNRRLPNTYLIDNKKGLTVYDVKKILKDIKKH